MTFDAITMKMLGVGVLEAPHMAFLFSAVAYLIGIPLGVMLVVADKDGIVLLLTLQKALGLVTNLLCSVPFIILLIMVLPFAKLVVGTALDPKMIVVPSVMAAASYVAQVVESSFEEMGVGVIEAVKSMRANTFQIVWKVLLPGVKPSLLVDAAIPATTTLGYSAITGLVGDGGLGAIVINYGYYRYDVEMMLVTAAILIIIVQIIQEPGAKLVRVGGKRIR